MSEFSTVAVICFQVFFVLTVFVLIGAWVIQLNRLAGKTTAVPNEETGALMLVGFSALFLAVETIDPLANWELDFMDGHTLRCLSLLSLTMNAMWMVVMGLYESGLVANIVGRGMGLVKDEYLLRCNEYTIWGMCLIWGVFLVVVILMSIGEDADQGSILPAYVYTVLFGMLVSGSLILYVLYWAFSDELEEGHFDEGNLSTPQIDGINNAIERTKTKVTKPSRFNCCKSSKEADNNLVKQKTSDDGKPKRSWTQNVENARRRIAVNLIYVLIYHFVFIVVILIDVGMNVPNDKEVGSDLAWMLLIYGFANRLFLVFELWFNWYATDERGYKQQIEDRRKNYKIVSVERMIDERRKIEQEKRYMNQPTMMSDAVLERPVTIFGSELEIQDLTRGRGLTEQVIEEAKMERQGSKASSASEKSEKQQKKQKFLGVF